MYVYVCFCILEHLCNSDMDSTRKITSSLGRPFVLHLHLWVFLFCVIISIELLNESSWKRHCQQNRSNLKTHGGYFRWLAWNNMENIFSAYWYCTVQLKFLNVVAVKSFIIWHTPLFTVISFSSLSSSAVEKKIPKAC